MKTIILCLIVYKVEILILSLTLYCMNFVFCCFSKFPFFYRLIELISIFSMIPSYFKIEIFVMWLLIGTTRKQMAILPVFLSHEAKRCYWYKLICNIVLHLASGCNSIHDENIISSLYDIKNK